jgi:hypothetical protein
LHNTKGKGIGKKLLEMRLKTPTDYVISLGDRTTHAVNVNKKYEKTLIDKYNELVKEKKCETREMRACITRATEITYNGAHIDIEDLAIKENCVATYYVCFYLFTFQRGQKEIIVMFDKFAATSNVVLAPIQQVPSTSVVTASPADTTQPNTLHVLPPVHFINLIPEDNRICSICTECIANDSYLTKCYHLFHKTCIEKWVAMKGSAAACPVCRVV